MISSFDWNTLKEASPYLLGLIEDAVYAGVTGATFLFNGASGPEDLVQFMVGDEPEGVALAIDHPSAGWLTESVGLKPEKWSVDLLEVWKTKGKHLSAAHKKAISDALRRRNALKLKVAKAGYEAAKKGEEPDVVGFHFGPKPKPKPKTASQQAIAAKKAAMPGTAEMKAKHPLGSWVNYQGKSYKVIGHTKGYVYIDDPAGKMKLLKFDKVDGYKAPGHGSMSKGALAADLDKAGFKQSHKELKAFATPGLQDAKHEQVQTEGYTIDGPAKYGKVGGFVVSTHGHKAVDDATYAKALTDAGYHFDTIGGGTFHVKGKKIEGPQSPIAAPAVSDQKSAIAAKKAAMPGTAEMKSKHPLGSTVTLADGTTHVVTGHTKGYVNVGQPGGPNKYIKFDKIMQPALTQEPVAKPESDWSKLQAMAHGETPKKTGLQVGKIPDGFSAGQVLKKGDVVPGMEVVDHQGNILVVTGKTYSGKLKAEVLVPGPGTLNSEKGKAFIYNLDDPDLPVKVADPVATADKKAKYAEKETEAAAKKARIDAQKALLVKGQEYDHPVHGKVVMVNPEGYSDKVFVQNAVTKEYSYIPVGEIGVATGKAPSLVAKVNGGNTVQAGDTSSDLPTDPSKLTVKGSLGGSTGAKLVEDANGTKYVLKYGNNPGHLDAEVGANDVYAAAGVLVPKHAKTKDNGQITEFIDGQTLDKLSGMGREAAYKELGKHFVLDAVLGNRDVVGPDLANVMVDKDGKVYRVDNGASFDYRAQGGKKEYTADVVELASMRNHQVNPATAKVYAHLTDAEIHQQALKLQERKAEILAATPEKYRDIVGQRIDDAVAKTAPKAQGDLAGAPNLKSGVTTGSGHIYAPDIAFNPPAKPALSDVKDGLGINVGGKELTKGQKALVDGQEVTVVGKTADGYVKVESPHGAKYNLTGEYKPHEISHLPGATDQQAAVPGHGTPTPIKDKHGTTIHVGDEVSWGSSKGVVVGHDSYGAQVKWSTGEETAPTGQVLTVSKSAGDPKGQTQSANPVKALHSKKEILAAHPVGSKITLKDGTEITVTDATTGYVYASGGKSKMYAVKNLAAQGATYGVGSPVASHTASGPSAAAIAANKWTGGKPANPPMAYYEQTKVIQPLQTILGKYGNVSNYGLSVVSEPNASPPGSGKVKQAHDHLVSTGWTYAGKGPQGYTYGHPDLGTMSFSTGGKSVYNPSKVPTAFLSGTPIISSKGGSLATKDGTEIKVGDTIKNGYGAQYKVLGQTPSGGVLVQNAQTKQVYENSQYWVQNTATTVAPMTPSAYAAPKTPSTGSSTASISTPVAAPVYTHTTHAPDKAPGSPPVGIPHAWQGDPAPAGTKGPAFKVSDASVGDQLQMVSGPVWVKATHGDGSMTVSLKDGSEFKVPAGSVGALVTGGVTKKADPITKAFATVPNAPSHEASTSTGKYDQEHLPAVGQAVYSQAHKKTMVVTGINTKTGVVDLVDDKGVDSYFTLPAKAGSGINSLKPYSPDTASVPSSYGTTSSGNKGETPFSKKEGWPTQWVHGETTKYNPQWVAAQEAHIASLPEASKSAIKSYTGNAYDAINTALRNDKTPGNKTLMKGLDTAMSKSTADHDMIVYRGIGHSTVTGQPVEFTVGQVFRDKGYMSTSVVKGSEFGGSTKMEILVPKGARGVYARAVSKFANEDEFLLARDSAFIVHEITHIGGTRYIRLEVIPPEAPGAAALLAEAVALHLEDYHAA